MAQPGDSLQASRRRLSLAEYVGGILEGNRAVLARAITVVESDLPSDVELGEQILEAVLPHTGKSVRMGITGAPGSGKSTFIDALGTHLVRERGERVAVLAVDPSSPISGGSVLGDKTRMQRLATEDKAFIRPSPSRGHRGGVARRTRETMLLCEAAGFENVLIETVGVGQSETAVRGMTDFFLLLLIPGAGDELQGIKRGVLELIDAIAVNKADGGNLGRAERARADYSSGLHLFAPASDGWTPRVVTSSAVTGEGIATIWSMVLEHRTRQEALGSLEKRRRAQSVEWMRDLIAAGLEDLFHQHAAVLARLPELSQQVSEGKLSAFAGARALLCAFASDQPAYPDSSKDC